MFQDTQAREQATLFAEPERRPRLHVREERMAGLFVSPALSLFAIFTVLPLFMALLLSFTNYDIISRLDWVGVRNYRTLLTDTLFHRSLINVSLYTLMFVPTMIALSLLAALALNRKVPGMAIFRTIFYLPVVTSTVAASTVWITILNKDYGLLNQLLLLIGVDGPAWLANSNTALFSIVMLTLWQGLGANMIIYLAGLQGVPEQLYEAANLDGANTWQRFRYITLPSVRSVTFFVTTLSLIGAFQLFDQAYVLTQGGPGYATTTPVYYIYQSGFNRLQMGYASAQAFVLFLIILVFSATNLLLNREQNLA